MVSPIVNNINIIYLLRIYFQKIDSNLMFDYEKLEINHPEYIDMDFEPTINYEMLSELHTSLLRLLKGDLNKYKYYKEELHLLNRDLSVILLLIDESKSYDIFMLVRQMLK